MTEHISVFITVTYDAP